MSKTGTVKFFNEMKGFGFIMQDDGGEDLFAHANNVADGQQLVEGDRVSFVEQWDDMKGKPLAANISGGSGGAAMGGGGGGGGKKGGGKKGGGGFKGGKGGGFPGDMGGGGFGGGGMSGGFGGGGFGGGGMPPPGGGGGAGLKSGTVKFFNDMKGFGFIMQDDGGEDLFAHRNNVADGQNLVEGDQVFFSETWDDMKGKSLAMNITGGTGGSSFGGGGGGYGGGKGFGKKGGKF